MRPPKSKKKSKGGDHRIDYEGKEIQLLESWIEAQKPDSGTIPLGAPPLPSAKSPVGLLPSGDFSPYAGCRLFCQLPLSKKTQSGLRPKYKEMSDIQRASIPHSLCGRDILGAAKTGSGKTLAFIIPVIEKLYRARWSQEDGVGCIIISPTKELAGQLFEELKRVGKLHSLSAGLLIGGRKDVDAERERINLLNILVCTPGRLLQHMDESPNFDCSQLQVLVLDEADRILDAGFKKEVNAIVSQLPKHRQTMLFSATQTKSVKDLARLSLKDPEYISVHAESVTATPEGLKQIAMEVTLDQKLNMLWSFIKTHLNKKILVFLTTCKQVKFVHDTFKKLRPGIPLKCLHGRMKQNVRLAIYQEFCEKTSVLFSTDVASRGLDFPDVDWVVQVDCPEDVPTYIHRVGRTARFTSGGKSILFIMPSEMEMITKLRASEQTIPIQLVKANKEKLQPVSDALSSLLVKYPNMQSLAERALITYLRSIKQQRDKEIFDVFKLPIEEYAVSLGLPISPKILLLNQKMKGKKVLSRTTHLQENRLEGKTNAVRSKIQNEAEERDAMEDDILYEKKSHKDAEKSEVSPIVDKRLEEDEVEDEKKALKVKKKKLKINLHKPLGTRLKFDEDGNAIPPLAAFAGTTSLDGTLQADKVEERYKKLKEEMQKEDKVDKRLHKKRLHEKRIKEKMKMKQQREEEEEEATEEGQSDTDEEVGNKLPKRRKIYFSEVDDVEEDEMKGNQGVDFACDSISVAEQEALALKLLSSMNP